MKPLRVAYMGTPDFAVPAQQALIDSPHEVVCVYSQPPRPKGRGHQLQKSPVHLLAEARSIPVLTPLSLRKDEQAQKEFAAHDLDVAVVAAYGLLLPKAVLEAPRYGCLNIHASLLPRWRGASPIQQAIWAGDRQSGISIMQMDEGLDTGPVVKMQSLPITGQTTAQSLHDELAALGAQMIIAVLDELARTGELKATPQGEEEITYAPLLKKEDGKVNWIGRSAVEIDRQVRALNPWPGVWTLTPDGKRLKITATEPTSQTEWGDPGTVLDQKGHVLCGDGTVLRLGKVQPENAKVMDAVSAINGGYLAVGDKLGG